ncbi:serine/threonine protein kinase [Archangium violaceum]|uniref:serine/threonine protein kinase n=1 Tax=Archangium violaceum TaxID=83451 RepID=UPI00193B5B36|nr:serine/threonine-protein kinase [Archangium violaceum]QRK06541.1 serine/threonine protein kinase [Archangium violaceum]
MSSAYRLTGRIEAGELADLYEAVQEPGGARVVIKLFHPKTSDPRYAAVLAQTYSVLNPLHPEGVLHVLDMGFVKNRLAVVRESVDGHTLGTALQRLNSKEVLLPPPVALHLIIQLLESVERAHAVGVVHGAITPGNVLLSRAGLPAVCDFGALQALMGVPELKRAFVGRGRSAYRAPEVGRGDMPDVLSDIYSMGAMAYELLTLREAVVPDGGVSTRRAGLPPPSRLDRRLHARLDPIILRALEATPTRRFRSCAEFAGSLRNFLSTNGGLPGAEDSRRFVAELFPNEVSVGLGPVPFSERFTLTPISGVSLAQVSADALDKSVVVRPSFSPALSEADTMEAPPAFDDYLPEPTVVPGPAMDRRVLDSTHVFTGDPPKEEVLEPTHVSAKASSEAGRSAPPGDDEQTWVAPPGAAPPKPRRGPVLGGAAAAAREGTRVGKHPRLRVVEDYSRPESPSEAPSPAGDAEDRIDTEKIEGTVIRSRVPEGTVTRARVPPSLVRGHVSEQPPTTAEPDRSYIPMPPPTSPEVKAAVSQRRLFTEERNLQEDARRRRRMLAVAGAIALVGAVCFAFALWRFSQRPQLETDPKVSAVSGAVEQYLHDEPSTPPPEPSKPRHSPPAEPVVVSTPGTREDSPKPGVAYLSLEANRPARAYIDGVRVKRNLPLVRYPVRSGTREIIIETIGVPRHREVFQVSLERGEHRKLQQLFNDSLHR